MGRARAVRATRVLVADDNAASRRRLARHIAAHPRFEVVGVTADPRAARGLSRRLRPDIALVGARTPGLRGSGPWHGLGDASGAVIPVILLSAAPARVFGAGCGRIGVVTALPRDLPPADLLRAIAKVVPVA